MNDINVPFNGEEWLMIHRIYLTLKMWLELARCARTQFLFFGYLLLP